MRSLVSVRLAVVGVLAMAAAGGCDVNTALEDIHEARHLAADLLVQFTKAADASNLAVMADTDDASKAFAAEATQRTATVQKDIEGLRSVLRRRGFTEELGLLDQFQARFEEYFTVDRNILALAVENTNLKAQRLSFTAAQRAVDDLGAALATLEPSSDSKEGWRVKALTASALASAREIQALQAPHIAEPSDEVMTQIETRMARADETARRELAALKRYVGPGSQPAVARATVALDRLLEANRQIVDLSRRNTNVRSLARALDHKRPLVTACEERLHALQAALAKRGYVSTR